MEIHWFKDNLKLHETHQTILKSFGKTHILVFVNVAYQDSGVVTFVAGRSKTSSRLKVKGTFMKRQWTCLFHSFQNWFDGLYSLSFSSFSHEALPSYLPRGSQNGRGSTQQRPAHMGPCPQQPDLHPIHLCRGETGSGLPRVAEVFHLGDGHVSRGRRGQRAVRRRLPVPCLLHQQVWAKWPRGVSQSCPSG